MGISYLSPFLFLTSISLTIAGPHWCSNNSSSSGGVDVVNRNTLLYGMPSHAVDQGGYYYSLTENTSEISTATKGSSAAASAEYCLGLCRKDLSSSENTCSGCLTNSIFDITHNCPYQREVIGWGDDAGCVVRCSPHEFPHLYETQPVIHVCNSSTVMKINLNKFEHAFTNLTSSIAERASDDVSHHYFAKGDMKFSSVNNYTIYGVGFCLPTLIPNSCTACLRAAANYSEKLCHGREGATIFTPSCILRYELYNFLESSKNVAPSTNNTPSPLIKKEAKSRRMHMVPIVVPLMAVVAVISFTSCTTIILKKRKQKGAKRFGVSTTESCLEFSLHSIRVATNEFSAINKLGQGGFGAVYKGRLRNGQHIAVKRLAIHSLRGEVEFKNEVRLLAKLHHKNLIKLIGFCLEGKERLLVYELALNGSLDRFLFDSTKRDNLTWEFRYNIIKGIISGIVYLHEECETRIIHRDLKASNILLDEWMNPKISDFGTARLYVEDQATASKIVGTYGYMSPEYVKHGKISIKMDVFSFGVLLLEIVCGKRNNASIDSLHIDHLLSKVWKYWTSGNLAKIIDPMLLRTSCVTEEITRCIHVGLLCVQENATSRPTMKSVEQMVIDCSLSLPLPLKPAYLMIVGEDEPYVSTVDQNYLDFSKAQVSVMTFEDFISVNHISITQPYPNPR